MLNFLEGRNAGLATANYISVVIRIQLTYLLAMWNFYHFGLG